MFDSRGYGLYRIINRLVDSRFQAMLHQSPSLSRSFGEASPSVLYLHIPFCPVHCSFCTFFTLPADTEQIKLYMERLERDIDSLASQDYSFRRIFIGGGSPLSAGTLLSSCMEKLQCYWPRAEISLEISPHSLSRFQELGLPRPGRLSIGMQSLQEDRLREIGRPLKELSLVREKLQEIAASEILLNIDLIYGFPGQELREMCADVRALIEIGSEELSWYPLITAKPLSRFDYVRYQRLLEQIQSGLSGSYRRVGPWTWLRSDLAVSSRTGGEYILMDESFIGIGAGSFSLCAGQFSSQSFSLDEYLASNPGDEQALILKIDQGSMQRYRYLMQTLLGLETAQAAPSPLLALLFRLGHLGEKRGGFLRSLSLRCFFRGVDRIREKMVE